MKLNDHKKIAKHAKQAANLLKVVGNESRLRILCMLAQGEQCVGDLLNNSPLSQSAFSQHLAVLRREKLVKTRKEAQSVHYSISNENVKKIIELLYKLYCQQ